MSHLIAKLQEKMDTNIHKMDINDPNQNQTTKQGQNNYLAQASLPAVLTGALQHFIATKDNYAAMQRGDRNLEQIFNNKLPEVVRAIAEYAHTSEDTAAAYLNKTFEALKDVVQQAPEINSQQELEESLRSQQKEIMQYLPGSLGLGNKLDLSGIDDRSNKFEGPLSTLANKMFNEDVKNDDERTE